MLRIRQWAAVAAWLALSTAGAQAATCTLSLVGSVTQQALIYNPFQAGATTAAVSFTLKNTDSNSCNVAFAFFKATAPQASAGGATVPYQVLSTSSASITQIAASPPSSMPSSGVNAATLTVAAGTTVTANATISVAQGQIVGPGAYSDQLTLGVYGTNSSGNYPYVLQTPLNVSITVNSQMTISVAGGGQSTTLDFGTLTPGAYRSVNLLAWSNQAFHVDLTSDNNGVMKRIDGNGQTLGSGQVPYTVTVNNAQTTDLSQKRSVSISNTATPFGGSTIPFQATIGPFNIQPAGNYRDVITISIQPGM